MTFRKIPPRLSGSPYLLDCCYPFLTHDVPYNMFLTHNVHATPPPLRPLTRVTLHAGFRPSCAACVTASTKW